MTSGLSFGRVSTLALERAKVLLSLLFFPDPYPLEIEREVNAMGRVWSEFKTTDSLASVRGRIRSTVDLSVQQLCTGDAANAFALLGSGISLIEPFRWPLSGSPARTAAVSVLANELRRSRLRLALLPTKKEAFVVSDKSLAQAREWLSSGTIRHASIPFVVIHPCDATHGFVADLLVFRFDDTARDCMPAGLAEPLHPTSRVFLGGVPLAARNDLSGLDELERRTRGRRPKWWWLVLFVDPTGMVPPKAQIEGGSFHLAAAMGIESLTRGWPVPDGMVAVGALGQSLRPTTSNTADISYAKHKIAMREGYRQIICALPEKIDPKPDLIQIRNLGEARKVLARLVNKCRPWWRKQGFIQGATIIGILSLGASGYSVANARWRAERRILAGKHAEALYQECSSGTMNANKCLMSIRDSVDTSPIEDVDWPLRAAALRAATLRPIDLAHFPSSSSGLFGKLIPLKVDTETGHTIVGYYSDGMFSRSVSSDRDDISNLVGLALISARSGQFREVRLPSEVGCEVSRFSLDPKRPGEGSYMVACTNPDRAQLHQISLDHGDTLLRAESGRSPDFVSPDGSWVWLFGQQQGGSPRLVIHAPSGSQREIPLPSSVDYVCGVQCGQTLVVASKTAMVGRDTQTAFLNVNGDVRVLTLPPQLKDSHCIALRGKRVGCFKGRILYSYYVRNSGFVRPTEVNFEKIWNHFSADATYSYNLGSPVDFKNFSKQRASDAETTKSNPVLMSPFAHAQMQPVHSVTMPLQEAPATDLLAVRAMASGRGDRAAVLLELQQAKEEPPSDASERGDLSIEFEIGEDGSFSHFVRTRRQCDMLADFNQPAMSIHPHGFTCGRAVNLGDDSWYVSHNRNDVTSYLGFHRAIVESRDSAAVVSLISPGHIIPEDLPRSSLQTLATNVTGQVVWIRSPQAFRVFRSTAAQVTDPMLVSSTSALEDISVSPDGNSAIVVQAATKEPLPSSDHSDWVTLGFSLLTREGTTLLSTPIKTLSCQATVSWEAGRARIVFDRDSGRGQPEKQSMIVIDPVRHTTLVHTFAMAPNDRAIGIWKEAILGVSLNPETMQTRLRGWASSGEGAVNISGETECIPNPSEAWRPEAIKLAPPYFAVSPSGGALLVGVEPCLWLVKHDDQSALRATLINAQAMGSDWRTPLELLRLAKQRQEAESDGHCKLIDGRGDVHPGARHVLLSEDGLLLAPTGFYSKNEGQAACITTLTGNRNRGSACTGWGGWSDVLGAAPNGSFSFFHDVVTLFSDSGRYMAIHLPPASRDDFLAWLNAAQSGAGAWEDASAAGWQEIATFPTRPAPTR